MGVIKPTLTLTANASSATTDAGPLSIALSLSATDSLSITKVESKIIDVDGTHGILFDASTYAASLGAGTDGGFIYLKNHDTAGHIYIGHGSSTALEGGTETTRLMTLIPGEFAFFPLLEFDGSDGGVEPGGLKVTAGSAAVMVEYGCWTRG